MVESLYLVLVNHEGHHSLWPAAEAVPARWESRHGPASRAEAIAYVESVWVDQVPRSLRRWLSTREENRHDGPG